MLRVTCAIIRDNSNRLLLMQHGVSGHHPWKWEFPGGKVEPKESDEECVIREIKEELMMNITVCDSLPEVPYDYGFVQINLVPFLCDTSDNEPVLTEHAAYEWVDEEDLLKYDLCEADVIVATNYLSYSKNVKSTSADNPQKGDVADCIKESLNAKYIEAIAHAAIDDASILKKLVYDSLTLTDREAFRASWIVAKVADTRLDLVEPYINFISEKILDSNNGGVIRMHLHTISLCDVNIIDEDIRGELIEMCFNNLKSKDASICLRTNCMDVLYKFYGIYPDLKNELVSTIKIVMTDGTAGIKARGKAILKKINK